MNEREFLALAFALAAGPTEGHWRTAVSRAYYAAFHTARRLLSQLGFHVPTGDRAHAYLWMRLQNCGESTVITAGTKLNSLRSARNVADYDLPRPSSSADALQWAKSAESVMQTLSGAISGPTRSQITAAMRVYERDVLRDVTWRP
jgi:uncharacterized protein (UPF0332 family)